MTAYRDTEEFPGVLYAQAVPWSISGQSLFDSAQIVTKRNAFSGDVRTRRLAADRLRESGFEVLHETDHSINIAAPSALYEEVFGVEMYRLEEDVEGGPGMRRAGVVEVHGADIPGLIRPAGSPLEGLLQGVALERPVHLFQESPAPPHLEYWHLRPSHVADRLRANVVHERGVTGRGVHVVMVDSGWYEHPYFALKRQRASVLLGPGTKDVGTDAMGHGTGVSANLLAVAPDVALTMVKLDINNATAAFNLASSLGASIISCSWGDDIENPPVTAIGRVLANAVALAVSRGIVVIFAAGNGQHGFPAQHPDVIATGGAFLAQDGALHASSQASGFPSKLFHGRVVPDVCGLVGLKAPGSATRAGMYITLPVPAGSGADTYYNNRNRRHYRRPGTSAPFGDETTDVDGWAVFSGTSSAAPQIAGVCALLKQTLPSLSPAAVRQLLLDTAVDVKRGAANPKTGGHAAAIGHDAATGHGLVNALRAHDRLRAAGAGP